MRSLLGFKPKNQVPCLDALASRGKNPLHNALLRGFNIRLHLHRLNHDQWLIAVHHVSLFNKEFHNLAAKRRSHLLWAGTIGFGSRLRDSRGGFISDPYRAGLSIEFKKQWSAAIRFNISNGKELYEKCLALFDLNRYFIAWLHAVEERRSRHQRGIAINGAVAVKFLKYAWIEKIGYYILVGYRTAKLFF